MKFSNNLYDILKWICLVVLPALAAFLSVLLPSVGIDADTVNTIITIVTSLATFIGILIGISTVAYNAENEKDKNA